MPQIHPEKKNGKVQKKNILKVKFTFKHIFVGLFLLFFLFSILISFSDMSNSSTEKPISSIISDVQQKKVKKIEIVGNKISVHYKNNKIVSTTKEEGESFIKSLSDAKVDPTSLNISV